MLTVCGAVPLLVWLGDIAVRRFRLAPSEVVDARMRVVELLRESRGAVDERQVAMAGRVLELSRRGVGALMTPWKRVASVADDALPQVVRETLRTRPRASYPVIDMDGACVGVVTSIDLLVEPDASPASIARKPVLVPASLPGLQALRLMREAGVSIAVVIDGRAPIGVVSVRDVLEPVLGRLPGW
jgi:CBS domain containing-hemolysin-like protein